MSFVKILDGEHLDEIFYERMRLNAKIAIERIRKFIESSKFEEADNILLETNLELLNMNFMKFMQCNDLLVGINSRNDSSNYMEDTYTEIKTKLMTKEPCKLKTASEQPTIKSAINIPKFDGNKDNYKAFIDSFKDKVDQNSELSTAEKINYLTSSLSGDVMALIKEVIPKDDTIYKEMLEVLKQKFENGNNIPTKPKKKEEESEMELGEKLYYNIVQAAYSDAVNVTKNIFSRGHGDIITSVMNKLSQEGNRNLLSYVYQLWQSDKRDVVMPYMPKSIQTIFNDWVTLKHKKFGLPLKMDVNTDRDGDRTVWGDASDKTSRRVNWKLIPFWENNRVLFHIQNFEHGMFLKLEIKPDGIGDRGAFGSKGSGTTRHEWLLEPVKIDGDVFFYIINREYYQGLKLAEATDSYGDRKLWGHNGDFHSEPTRFAWSINLGLFEIV